METPEMEIPIEDFYWYGQVVDAIYHSRNWRLDNNTELRRHAHCPITWMADRPRRFPDAACYMRAAKFLGMDGKIAEYIAGVADGLSARGDYQKYAALRKAMLWAAGFPKPSA